MAQYPGFFLLAWLLSRLAGILSRRVIRLGGLASQRSRPERQKTLYGLVQGIITVTFFIVAVLLSLSQFVETTTLVWMIGLFGAGFGLSARPLISDVMAGTSFIFEDTFAVGEKVEMLDIEGIIEFDHAPDDLAACANRRVVYYPQWRHPCCAQLQPWAIFHGKYHYKNPSCRTRAQAITCWKI